LSTSAQGEGTAPSTSDPGGRAPVDRLMLGGRRRCEPRWTGLVTTRLSVRNVGTPGGCSSAGSLSKPSWLSSALDHGGSLVAGWFAQNVGGSSTATSWAAPATSEGAWYLSLADLVSVCRWLAPGLLV